MAPKPASYASVAAAQPPSTGHAPPTSSSSTAAIALPKRQLPSGAAGEAETVKPVWSLQEASADQADQVPLGEFKGVADSVSRKNAAADQKSRPCLRLFRLPAACCANTTYSLKM